MSTGFFADLIIRKPPLFAAMLVFNGFGGECPQGKTAAEGTSDLLDLPVPERLTAVPGVDATALWSLEAVRRRYEVSAMPAGGDAPSLPAFWDFADERHRLALLDAPTLQCLAQVFGVAVHAADIARVITREQVLELREALGDALYTYALHRGQYQLGDLANVFLEADQRTSLPERIELHGVQALEICCAVWPAALRQRVAPALADVLPSLNTFLPQQAAPSARAFRPSTLPQSLHRNIWFSLKKLLLKEVAPQWAPYFD